MLQSAPVSDSISPELFAAVERDFGSISLDLAASAENTKCARFIDESRNSFSVDWAQELANGRGWLNPPAATDLLDELQGSLAKWAEKCTLEAQRGARIISIWPAAIDTAWFWRSLVPHSALYIPFPRLNYESQPRPVVIAVCNGRHKPGQIRVWNWQRSDSTTNSTSDPQRNSSQFLCEFQLSQLAAK